VRYATSIRFQDHPGETIEELKDMVKELLMTFYCSARHKPLRILFYRDGIGATECTDSLKMEIGYIRDACRELDESFQPTITYVIARRNHHARFFPISKHDTDRSGNVMSGTVVDQGVVHNNVFEFYLNSHAGIQGTSRPILYTVLHDENQMSPDSIQQLTNNLCYIYARCTRSVSVASPVYYARLAAFRARFQTEENDIFKHLPARAPIANQMYFL
jgi:eukaryotic translation initiation factor 2C